MSSDDAATSARSAITVEATEINDQGVVTEATIWVEREAEPDPELSTQQLILTPAELSYLFVRLRMYFEQGIWSFGTVER